MSWELWFPLARTPEIVRSSTMQNVSLAMKQYKLVEVLTRHTDDESLDSILGRLLPRRHEPLLHVAISRAPRPVIR